MKRLLYLTILLITTATTAQADNLAMAFWNTYDARKAPLNSEEVITWDTDDGHYQLVRYDLGKLTGTNKAAAPVIAAYYGYPKGGRNLPGVVISMAAGNVPARAG